MIRILGVQHPCPVCNNLTVGAMSEGGLHWAICDDCMEAARRKEPKTEEKYEGPPNYGQQY